MMRKRSDDMLGFDIGGTKCAVSVGENAGGVFTISDKRVMPTDLSVSPYEMLDRLIGAAREITNDFSKMGISCGGPLDAARGVILSPPNLPGWDEVEVVSYLEKSLGGKAYLCNDADACALAEWQYGAGRGSHTMAFLTFGTGLGSGLILGDRLWQGSHGLAGEVGHIRLAPRGPVGYHKKGSFEGFCSGGGIRQLGQMAAREVLARGEILPYCKNEEELDGINARVLADYARQGEPVAMDIFKAVGRRLGSGLAILADVIDPEVIVIGSVFARCEDLIRPHMEPIFTREALVGDKCRIVPAALGEQIGDYAALTVAQMEEWI